MCALGGGEVRHFVFCWYFLADQYSSAWVYSFVLGLCFKVFRYCKTINMIKNSNQSIHPNQNYSREKFGNFLANWKKELTEYYHLIKIFLQVPLYGKNSSPPKVFFKSQKLSTQNLGDNGMKCYTRKTFSKFS